MCSMRSSVCWYHVLCTALFVCKLCTVILNYYPIMQVERVRAEGHLQLANEQLHRQNTDLQSKDQRMQQMEAEIQQARSQLRQKDILLNQKVLELNNSQQQLQVALCSSH